MGVKKLVTRILNGVYLAGAAVAVVGLATQPVLSLGINIEIPGDLITDLIKDNIPGGEDEGESKVYRANIKRDGGSGTDDIDFVGMLSKVDLDGVFDGLVLQPKVELPSLVDFLKYEEEERPLLIKNVVTEAINYTLDTSIDTLMTGFNKLVPAFAKVAAKELAIGPVVKDQIANVMKLDIQDEAVAEKFAIVEQKIDTLVDNVWDTLTVPKEDGTPTTVDDVMNTVTDSINDIFSTLADVGVEGFEEGMEFDEESLADIKEGMQGMLQEVGLANEAGEIQNMNDALAMMISMLSDGLGNIGGNTSSSDSENHSHQLIPLDMVQNIHLEMIGGTGYIVWDEVQFATKYVVTINDQEYEVEEPQITGELNEGTNFVTILAIPSEEDEEHRESREAVVIINVEGGVPSIVEETPSRRITREGDPEEAPVSDDDLKQMITDLIKPLIEKLPLDTLSEFNLDKLVGIENATLYAYIGLFVLAAFPWLLFGLITIIRTIRKRKCWTKPWVVFVFAFLEVIFGALLYFAFKYGLAMALPLIESNVELPTIVGQLIPAISIEFKVFCLWASFVYLAMIPFTIVYMVFAHGPKKEFKIWKKSKKYAKKIAKGKLEFSEVKAKFQEETAKILKDKYNITAHAAK